MDMDAALRELDIRYRKKKRLNLALSFLILFLGISALRHLFSLDNEGILAFRWMTVDGTVYTLLMTAFFAGVKVVELAKKTELTRRPVYFARLSAAVAESLILTVVLISRLPVFPEHMHLARYDMCCMHLLIPLLAVTSFVLNDSPLGKLKFREMLAGTSFVLFYAPCLVALVGSGVIAGDMIPYFFLDYRHLPAPAFLGYWTAIFALSLLFSGGLAHLNRKLYWRWFKDLVRGD